MEHGYNIDFFTKGVRLTNELPTYGKSMVTSRQLIGEFKGPGKIGGQRVEIEAEEGWERMVGRYLAVQMDHSEKKQKKHGFNLNEVTGFGQTWKNMREKVKYESEMKLVNIKLKCGRLHHFWSRG